MKRKISFLAIAFMCAVLCVCGLAACGDNTSKGTDKSFQNTEFVEYRKKVTAVLKDNGIFVNDFDSEESGAKEAVALAATYPDSANTIHDIIMAAEPTDNYVWAKEDRDDIFEQTLFISLILGDAISNYHNESNFYGNAVYFEYWGQYFEVVKNGNNDLVRCYTPASEYMSDSVLTMELNYKSVTNYSFTCMQIWETQSIYCYGNSQKEYFRVSKDFEANDNYIYYMPNDSEGYYCTSESAVEECYNLVKDTVDSVDVAPIKALPDRIKYTITEEQGEETLEKYFGDTGSSESEERGMIYAEMGDMKFGDWYNAFDEKVIVIPAECEYLSENFNIRDNTDSVEKVIIPSTVKGIVTYKNSETGEAYDTPRLINLDELNEDDFGQLRYWFLAVDCDGYDGGKKLREITVESGSAYFKAGSGNLYTASGKLLYLTDKSLGTVFSVEDYDDNLLNYIFYAAKENNYKNLLSDVTTLNITLPFDNQEFMYITENMPNLTTVNISGAVEQAQNHYDLPITVSGDLTVTIDITCDLRDGLPGLRFISERKHKVTVNIPYVCPVPNIDDHDVSVNVKVGIPQDLYLQIFGWINEENIGFADGSLTDIQKRAFEFGIHNRSGKTELTAVLINGDANTVEVPRTYGLDVTALSINCATDDITVGLHDGIRYLLFEGDSQNFALVYDGTIAEFEENVQIICYAQEYSFTLKDKDNNVKTYSGGFSVPEEELCTVTLVYTDKTGTEQTVVMENYRKGYPLSVYEYEEAMRESDEDIFAWWGDDGSVSLYYTIEPNGDAVYTAVKLRTYWQDFSLSYNGLEIAFNYNWSSGNVESCNASYKGVAMIFGDRNIDGFVLFSEDKNNYFEIKLTFGYKLDNDGYLSLYIKGMTGDIL